MPKELILHVAESLSSRDLSRLLRVNHFLQELLSPVLLKRAVTTLVGPKRRRILHWASSHNRSPLVALLLERGVSVDTEDENRMTALHPAVIQGYETPVKLLLDNGVNPEAESGIGWTPLLLAAITGNSTITRLLLEKGVNIELTPGGYSDQNALHHAAAFGHLDVVNVLIEMGCKTGVLDLYAINAVQISALFWLQRGC